MKSGSLPLARRNSCCASRIAWIPVNCCCAPQLVPQPIDRRDQLARLRATARLPGFGAIRQQTRQPAHDARSDQMASIHRHQNPRFTDTQSPNSLIPR